MITRTYLILTFLGVALVANGNVVPEHKEWQSIKRKLYSVEGPQLNPGEVLKQLERANELFEILAESLSDDERNSVTEMQDLIAISKAVGLFCDVGSFQRFEVLINQHKLSYKHILPYLLHQNLEHYMKCKSKVVNGLNESVFRLSNDTKRYLRLLSNVSSTEAVCKLAGENQFNIPEANLKNGLLALMQSGLGRLNSEALLNVESGKRFYEQKFNYIVKAMCSKVDKALEQSLAIYETLLSEENIVKEMDDLTKEWILYGRACKRIIQDNRAVIDMSYDALVENSLSDPQRLFAEWERVNDQVFSRKAEEISPSKTLEYLRRLERIYPKLEASGLIMKPKPGLAVDRNLIELSNINEEKCNAASLKALNDAVGINFMYNKNVLPYLKDLRLKLFNVCKPIYGRELVTATSLLTEEQRNDAKILVADLFESEVAEVVKDNRNLSGNKQSVNEVKKSFNPRFKKLERGILAFLRDQSYKKTNIELARKISPYDFSQMYKNWVTKLCAGIEKVMKGPMEVYKQIIQSKELVSQLDQFAKDWILRVEICKIVKIETDDLIESSHGILSGRRESMRNWDNFGTKVQVYDQ